MTWGGGAQVGTGADEKPGKSEEDVKAWDAEFVKVDQGTLFELILVRARVLAALVCSWRHLADPACSLRRRSLLR